MKKAFRVLFSLLLIFASFGIFISNKVMFLKRREEEEIVHQEAEAGHLIPGEYESLPKTEVTIPSSFGYEVKAILVEPHDTNHYIIISHGVTQSKMNSIKYMNLFLNRGFNAVIYDHRRHGESGGKTTSYGYYEKFDLQSVVHWLRKEKGSDLLLGIHGESMGAATLLLYAGMLEDGADFYIADCPFSDFSEQLAYRIKEEVKLFPPKLLLPVANLFIRIRDKYSLSEVSPIAVIENIKNPILFIHSRMDDFILPSMTEALFKQKKGPKKLFMAENGLHAQSYSQNQEQYEKVVDEFLEEYVF
ncbi:MULTISPECIES: alpha/beta hydrolase [Mesobacillus]|uniref:Xaa-Pro dipeptidyl-peptidase-like domain-containing protein n=2 Tax=Mesobacillus TaxID=2675231 RepID=A0A0D6ZFJ5_9BACI|nr:MULTISPECIES: alpha/beta hydrolase [Mesobacillus]KIY23846.1 hypothetical protein UB32_00715 [Mesobacillus subterraneus]MDQ0413763.1 fermentation-respiration switch protein FrsA (DUF1100 family) [Mesobacillus stamsii]